MKFNRPRHTCSQPSAEVLHKLQGPSFRLRTPLCHCEPPSTLSRTVGVTSDQPDLTHLNILYIMYVHINFDERTYF